MPKLSEAQRRFLQAHLREPEGLVPRFNVTVGKKTYDFVGRIRDLGMIEIEDGECAGWPYSWKSTRITPAGRRALEEG